MFRSSGSFVYTVPAYMVVLMTMTWRSVDKSLSRRASNFELCAGIGGILFVISDSLLAFSLFNVVDMHEKLAHVLIMSTYYGAQLSMALSTAAHHTV